VSAIFGIGVDGSVDSGTSAALRDDDLAGSIRIVDRSTAETDVDQLRSQVI
jgi:hypothetical protein